ncbi:TPA: hypothetical protein DCZ39_01025 [Patescibacteria group bacterium]|nr:hypothetical protein [Candidatus Gracilibacteria bacterium]
MQFSNDDITRSSREAFATTKAWTLSAGTGTKTVYANFDTDNNTATIEAIGNDTINYIDVLTGCIGDSCADITLEILSNGDGYCDIGDSVDFGLT